MSETDNRRAASIARRHWGTTPARSRSLRFGNFLSPVLHPTYAYISTCLGNHLGIEVTLQEGESIDDLTAGKFDVAFLCGLPYVQLALDPDCPIEILAAPVLRGERYEGKPQYFSDLLVRSTSSYSSFNDLQGAVFAYNEKESHSGYNIVARELIARKKTLPYFNAAIKSGSHTESVQMVVAGQADAAAVDSHVLDIMTIRDSEFASCFRIVDVLGPSASPPVVVAKRLDPLLKESLRRKLLVLHEESTHAMHLHKGLIDRFVSVEEDHCDDIRRMFVQGKTASTFLAKSY